MKGSPVRVRASASGVIRRDFPALATPTRGSRVQSGYVSDRFTGDEVVPVGGLFGAILRARKAGPPHGCAAVLTSDWRHSRDLVDAGSQSVCSLPEGSTSHSPGLVPRSE